MTAQDPVFDEAREALRADAPIEVDRLLLVVVGAQLRAEVADRPLADRLVRRMRQWQRSELDDFDDPLMLLACTDMWYLNETSLLTRPVIVIGEPGVNAASAFYATRLPQAIVVDDAWEIRMDPELVDPRVAIWGEGPAQTEKAVDEFTKRYLDRYLRAVHFK